MEAGFQVETWKRYKEDMDHPQEMHKRDRTSVFLGLSSGGLSFSYYFITSFRFQML
jgi:hypothetical protein